MSSIHKVNPIVKLIFLPTVFLIGILVTKKYGGNYWEYVCSILKRWFKD